MSSPNIIKSPSCSDECGMNELPAELKLEICTCLEVHGQRAMRRLCKSWRSIAYLSKVLLSRWYVDIDTSKILNQPEKPQKPHFADMCDYRYGYWTGTGYTPRDVYDRELPQRFDDLKKYENYLTVTENRLEHALNQHLHKNTKILVLRNVAFKRNQFDVVVKAIKGKVANLIQLVLKDCQEQGGSSAYWYVEGQYRPMRDLMSVTRRLILDNYTMRNVLSRAGCDWEMSCSIGHIERHRGGNMFKKVPVVVPRHVFDCSKPLFELYPSFIMVLNSNCPEVSPQIRHDVVQLYHSWKQSNAHLIQWQSLGFYIQSLNEGVCVARENVDVSALQHLDPRTLNKLTMEALHRMYCLPCP